MSDARLRLAFAGLHPDRLAALVDRYNTADAVLEAIRVRRIKMKEEVRAAVLVPAVRRRRLLERAGISFLAHGGPGYPAHLAALPDAPPGLFVRGDLPPRAGVAVVGTRRCTAYGRRLAASYGRAIADAGWTLVSGLARGIDGAAHRGTNDAGGVGVAVLGSGVDVVYPREHGELTRGLLAGGGAIVSEYPPGAPPFGWRFPPRNRIISGLSRAVVVVEAGVKGGALITARLAVEQGITVFAVPGDVQRASSRGCNLLIRDGAHPVLDPDDLVEELALVLGPPRRDVGEVKPGVSDPIVGLVAGHGDVSVDAVAAQLKLPIAEVLARAVELETAGAIEFDGMTLRANGH